MRWTEKAARLAALVGIAAMCSFGLVGALEAQTPRAQQAPSTLPLTLEEAVSRALDFYPSVGAARAMGDAAQATVGQAKSAWWPELGLAGSLTQYQEPMIVTPIHAFDPGATPEFDQTLFQGGGYLTYTLFDGGERQARIRTATGEASAAGANLGIAMHGLIADVVRLRVFRTSATQ